MTGFLNKEGLDTTITAIYIAWRNQENNKFIALQV